MKTTYVISERKKNFRETKVQLPLCLIKVHAMKMYGGIEARFHTLFTSALDGGASRPLHLILGKIITMPLRHQSG
jgi:hypothetical protein